MSKNRLPAVAYAFVVRTQDGREFADSTFAPRAKVLERVAHFNAMACRGRRRAFAKRVRIIAD